MQLLATPHTHAAELALEIYSRTVQTLDAELLMHRAVERAGHLLFIQGRALDLDQYQRVFIFGSGKASVEMGYALEQLLADRLEGGLLVAKGGSQKKVRLPVLYGGHPTPTAESIRAGERMLEEAAGVGEGDLVLYVLSGGSSALMEAPIPDLHLDDIQELNELLLASGEDIRSINRVRARVSRIKGGGLARAFAPATVVALVLSDVLGHNLAAVGSGPLLPADLTPINFPLPPKINDAVDRRIGIVQTPRVEHTVIGSVSLALHEATDAARALGLEPLAFADPIQGEARGMARKIVLQAEVELRRRDKPFCMIFGGEATVKIRGNGKGGRCQEMAVAAAMRLSRMPDCCFLAAGTDGMDGPTDAAGGFVDELTCERAVELGQDVRTTLRKNDSHAFLDSTDYLIRTGHTGTNVNDLALVVGNVRSVPVK